MMRVWLNDVQAEQLLNGLSGTVGIVAWKMEAGLYRVTLGPTSNRDGELELRRAIERTKRTVLRSVEPHLWPQHENRTTAQ